MGQNLAQTAVKSQENMGFSLCGTIATARKPHEIRGMAIMEFGPAVRWVRIEDDLSLMHLIHRTDNTKQLLTPYSVPHKCALCGGQPKCRKNFCVQPIHQYVAFILQPMAVGLNFRKGKLAFDF